MWIVKYCVATVGQTYRMPDEYGVTFYAFSNDAYGLHKVSNITNENVIWYNSEAEAMRHRMNASDCVVSRGFEEV